VSFDTVLKEPAALLYLPGNLLGVFVGVLAAVGWVGWKLWHHQGEKRPVAKSLAFSLGVSLVSILAFASVLALVPRPVQESPVAAEADLVLPTLDGSAVSLTKAPGKVLFVNFWATWCPPCRAEIPGFVDYWKTAPRDAVEIRAVDLTTSERQPDLVRPFVAAEGMTFPVLLDPAGEAATRYQIESIPTTLVFDPQGQLVYRQVGVLSRDQMEALVRQYRP
jgi:thiol-disulfide isomerase/thioredoxin